MSHPRRFSGPQFQGDRPVEQEAVRTTIVGGRPPGSGKRLGAIPRGVEILVKKASVDPKFKRVLLTERAQAAAHIGLELDPAETVMLAAVPATQLEAIIARTTVPQEHRRAFMGQAAAAMLAVMGLGLVGCGGTEPSEPAVTGIQPDVPEPGGTKGSRPDRPDESSGERPRRLEATEGTRPEEPGKPATEGKLDAEDTPTAKPTEEETEAKPVDSESDPGPFRDNPLRPSEVIPQNGIRPFRDDPPPPTRGIRPDLPPAPDSR